MREPTIVTRGLSKVFHAGEHTEVRAVRDVDLTVQPSDIVLIMGPSGSGKTTLVTLLGGLARPTAGTVCVSGIDIGGQTERARAAFRRRHVGFVFQSFQLLESLTAVENVAVGYRLAGWSRAESDRRARAALDLLGLGWRLDAFPRALSGGEQQRVSIARALANEPRVLFADEPTANLDARSGHQVMHLLCGIACEQGRTVVIVSHDERLREVAKRVLWMEDGTLTREEPGGHVGWCEQPHG